MHLLNCFFGQPAEAQGDLDSRENGFGGVGSASMALAERPSVQSQAELQGEVTEITGN